MNEPTTAVRSVRFNGEERPLGDDAMLIDLLREAGVDPDARGIAVAVNGAVVPRRAWGERRLAPGDTIEVVKLFSGG